MAGVHQRGVELEQGFAAGEDDEAPRPLVAPDRGQGVGKPVGIAEAAAAVAVGADEVGVAKTAESAVAILLAA